MNLKKLNKMVMKAKAVQIRNKRKTTKLKSLTTKAMTVGLHASLKHLPGLQEHLVLAPSPAQSLALLLNHDQDRDPSQSQSLGPHQDPDRDQRPNPDLVQDQSRRPSHRLAQNRRLEADLQANRPHEAVLRVNLRHGPGLHLDLLQDRNLDRDHGPLLSLDQVLTVSKSTSKFVIDHYEVEFNNAQ